MTVSLKHKFQSAKGNGADNTLVQPSNWNDEHNLTCSASVVLGIAAGGSAGAAAEIPMGSLGQTLLASAVLQDLINAGVPISTTGDVKLTLKTVADNGWIMAADQTLGPTGSTAGYANNNCQALYTLVWNNVSNTWAPVTGGRGASAAADWGAAKPIQLCGMLGRALAVAGAGSGLTSRTLGQFLGEETHTISTAEMPAHNHTLHDPGHGHTLQANTNSAGTLSGGANALQTNGTTAGGINSPLDSGTWNVNGIAVSNATGITLDPAGGGSAHNNVQPTAFLNVMVKL